MTAELRPNVHLTAKQGDAYRALVNVVREFLPIEGMSVRTWRANEKLREALDAIDEADKGNS